MKLLRESMTRVSTNRFVVRVWRQEKISGFANRCALRLRVSEIARRDDCALEIAKKVIKLKGVNAVEVLNAVGDGELLYANWP